MSTDFTNSALVMRTARAAVELQMYFEQVLRSLGVRDVKPGWDVPGGWDSMPESATLVVDRQGRLFRETFTKDELLAFAAEQERSAAGKRLRELVTAVTAS